MRASLIWQVRNLLQQVDEALDMIESYRNELEAYCERTTPAQRRSGVEAVLDELNDYASRFAFCRELAPEDDIRVIFGLWARLAAWQEALLSWNQDDWLVVMDEHNTYESPLAYMLQPRLQAEGLSRHRVLTAAQVPGFLRAFERELDRS